MTFNHKLQELRKQKGLTQEELAQALYVSRTAISKWESGRGYPNIDSLKEIAKYFGTTVDELLSTDEVMVIAEQSNKQSITIFRDLVYGCLDLSMAMLLFLPFFAERCGNGILEASLLTLTGVSPWLKALYFLLIIGASLTGVMTLALQNFKNSLWLKVKTKISLGLGIAAVLLFILSLHPYAAVFTFVLLSIKGLMLIKRF